MNKSWLTRLSIIAGLSACFLLFQNFSLDHEFKDIRTFAPEGVPEEPRSGYFPEHIQSTNIKSLGNEILKHNFGDELKQFENQFEDWAGWEMGDKNPNASPEGDLAAAGRRPSSYRMRTGHLGKDRVGIMVESNFKFKCEYSALSQDLQLSLDKSLGRNGNLSLKHKTDDQQSSVNFSYAW